MMFPYNQQLVYSGFAIACYSLMCNRVYITLYVKNSFEYLECGVTRGSHVIATAHLLDKQIHKCDK